MLLIIGGAGYIGSHFVHTYAHQLPMLVLDDFSTGHAEAIPQHVPHIKGDYGNEKLLKQLFTAYNIDAVLHFAAKSIVTESTENPLLYYENNVAKTITLLQQMQSFNITKILFASTAAVYGQGEDAPIQEEALLNPLNPYGHSKRMVEQIIQDAAKTNKLTYCIFRFFNAAGAHDHTPIGEAHIPETHLIPLILKNIQQNKPITIYGQTFNTKDGTAIRDYLHVQDIAKAHFLAYEKMQKNEFPSAIINLGSNNGETVKSIIDKCMRITQQQIHINYANARQGEPAKLIANTAKAQQLLNWQPTYTTEEIIASAWRWHEAPSY